MGFVFFCILLFLVSSGAWRVLTRRADRASFVAGFKRRPGTYLVTGGMVLACITFAFGVLLPPLQQLEFFDTGWMIWQVGGVAAVALLVVSWNLPEAL